VLEDLDASQGCFRHVRPLWGSLWRTLRPALDIDYDVGVLRASRGERRDGRRARGDPRGGSAGLSKMSGSNA
jgi:hypothetical protein